MKKKLIFEKIKDLACLCLPIVETLPPNIDLIGSGDLKILSVIYGSCSIKSLQSSGYF